MSRTSFHMVTFSCNRLGCKQEQRFYNESDAKAEGWGVVGTNTGEYDDEVIGDQNGWNNFDFCPIHFKEFLNQWLGKEVPQ